MATFEYFGMSRLHTRSSGNGVRLTLLDDTGTRDVGYDGARRPVLMRHLDPANALLAGFEYRYDRVGNRTSVRRLHDFDAVGNSRGNVYAYDSADRLLSSQEAYLDANHAIASPLFDQEAFSLDGPGNWASLTRNGSLHLNTPNNLNEYDEPQCCGTHVEDGLRDDFMDLAGTPTPDGLNLTYDRNGNQTDTVLQTLDYNFRNVPVAARNLSTGAPVSAYGYDALGRRVKRQVSGGAGTQGTRTYAYGHSLFPGAIEEDDASGLPLRQFGYGPGGQRLWQVQASGDSQYVLEDALGSAAALTPGIAAGGPPNVLERVVYDPYGKPTFESAGNQPLKDLFGRFLAESPNGNAYLLQGMRYDPELGSRSASVNADFGGLYAAGGYYNPNEGRSMTCANGRPDGNPASGVALGLSVEVDPGPVGSPASVMHDHGSMSSLGVSSGSLFAVYDSVGGYYGSNRIQIQSDPGDGTWISPGPIQDAILPRRVVLVVPGPALPGRQPGTMVRGADGALYLVSDGQSAAYGLPDQGAPVLDVVPHWESVGTLTVPNWESVGIIMVGLVSWEPVGVDHVPSWDVAGTFTVPHWESVGLIMVGLVDGNVPGTHVRPHKTY
jgi:hypothetical protein